MQGFVVKQNPHNPQNPGLLAFNCRTMAAAAAVGKTKIAATDPLIRPDKGLRKRSAQPCKAEPDGLRETDSRHKALLRTPW